MLKDEMRKRGISVDEFFDKEKFEKIYNSFQVSNYKDFMYAIAIKSLSSQAVIERLTKLGKTIVDEDYYNLIGQKNSKKRQSAKTKTGIIVKGVSSMKIALAPCCAPVFGDNIVGYVSKGQGIKVHRHDCPNALKDKSRLIDVSWNGNNENEYLANLKIVVDSTNSKLLDIIAICSTRNIVVDSVKTKNEDIDTIYILTLKIKDISELDTVITALDNLSYVKKIERVIN